MTFITNKYIPKVIRKYILNKIHKYIHMDIPIPFQRNIDEYIPKDIHKYIPKDIPSIQIVYWGGSWLGWFLIGVVSEWAGWVVGCGLNK